MNCIYNNINFIFIWILRTLLCRRLYLFLILTTQECGLRTMFSYMYNSINKCNSKSTHLKMSLYYHRPKNYRSVLYSRLEWFLRELRTPTVTNYGLAQQQNHQQQIPVRDSTSKRMETHFERYHSHFKLHFSIRLSNTESLLTSFLLAPSVLHVLSGTREMFIIQG